MAASARSARDRESSLMSDQIAEERPPIDEPQLPDDDLRCTPAPLVLVACDLRHAVALLERLHEHFLLDGREVRGETQLPSDVAPNRAESILTVGEPDVPAIVDRQRNQLRADIPDELFDRAVQFVAAAAAAGSDDHVGL